MKSRVFTVLLSGIIIASLTAPVAFAETSTGLDGFAAEAAKVQHDFIDGVCNNNESEVIATYAWSATDSYIHWHEIAISAGETSSLQNLDDAYQKFQVLIYDLKSRALSENLCASKNPSPPPPPTPAQNNTVLMGFPHSGVVGIQEIPVPKRLSQSEIDSWVADKNARVEILKAEWRSINAKIQEIDPICTSNQADFKKAESNFYQVKQNFDLWAEAVARGMTEQDLRNKGPSFTGPVTQTELDEAQKQMKELEAVATACSDIERGYSQQIEDYPQKIGDILNESSSLDDARNCGAGLDGFESLLPRNVERTAFEKKIWSSYTFMKSELLLPMSKSNYSASQYLEDVYVKSKRFLSDYSSAIYLYLGEGDLTQEIYPFVFCQEVPFYADRYKKDLDGSTQLLAQIQEINQEMEAAIVGYRSAVKVIVAIPKQSLKSKQLQKSITCVKGATRKKVTGTNPKCPNGYKKK